MFFFYVKTTIFLESQFTYRYLLSKFDSLMDILKLHDCLITNKQIQFSSEVIYARILMDHSRSINPGYDKNLNPGMITRQTQVVRDLLFHLCVVQSRVGAWPLTGVLSATNLSLSVKRNKGGMYSVGYFTYSSHIEIKKN